MCPCVGAAGLAELEAPGSRLGGGVGAARASEDGGEGRVPRRGTQAAPSCLFF